MFNNGLGQLNSARACEVEPEKMKGEVLSRLTQRLEQL